VDDIFARVWSHFTGRMDGPVTFRLVLQPLMAAALAIRAGVADGRAGRPPYFWSILTHPDHRLELLRDGWKAIGKLFVLAVVLDSIYELIVYRWIYPLEAMLAGFLLVCVPYLLLRGLAGRLARRVARPHDAR
jgi:hypothetical protein